MEVPVRQETQRSEIERASDKPWFTPRVDIYETDEAVTVVADLPGVPKDNVALTLEQGVLTLSARSRESEFEGAEGIACEYCAGDFYRSFRLGPQVDEKRMDASMKDGVLKVVIPKSDWAKTRKIEVK